MDGSGKETNTAKLTAPAARIWDAIPPKDRKKLLATAWCSHCREEVKLKDYSGSVKAGNVVLVGTCSECGGAAFRIVEAKPNEEGKPTVSLRNAGPTEAQLDAETKLLYKDSKMYLRKVRELLKDPIQETVKSGEVREIDKLIISQFEKVMALSDRCQNRSPKRR
jgi:hypothetical protein